MLKVAIITANYNGSSFIDDYFNGIKTQKKPPDYCVFIDDCSTDDSWKKIRAIFNTSLDNDDQTIEYKGDNTTFVAIKRPKNGGPAAARNTALQYLSDKNVDLVCTCDSDDYLYPEKLSESIKIFEKYPFVNLVYSDYDVLSTKTGTKGRIFSKIFDQSRLMQECIVTNNSVFRYQAAKDVGFYDEDREIVSIEDYLMWKKLSFGGAVYHIPKSLYCYRVHGDNLTVKTPRDVLEKRHSIANRKFSEFLKERNVSTR